MALLLGEFVQITRNVIVELTSEKIENSPRENLALHNVCRNVTVLAGVGGTVSLKARIGTDGRIAEVMPVTNQTIDPGLVTAAIDAVNQWEFTATLLNCVPVEVDMTVSVRFAPAR